MDDNVVIGFIVGVAMILAVFLIAPGALGF